MDDAAAMFLEASTSGVAGRWRRRAACSVSPTSRWSRARSLTWLEAERRRICSSSSAPTRPNRAGPWRSFRDRLPWLLLQRRRQSGRCAHRRASRRIAERGHHAGVVYPAVSPRRQRERRMQSVTLTFQKLSRFAGELAVFWHQPSGKVGHGGDAWRRMWIVHRHGRLGCGRSSRHGRGHPRGRHVAMVTASLLASPCLRALRARCATIRAIAAGPRAGADRFRALLLYFTIASWLLERIVVITIHTKVGSSIIRPHLCL